MDHWVPTRMNLKSLLKTNTCLEIQEKIKNNGMNFCISNLKESYKFQASHLQNSVQTSFLLSLGHNIRHMEESTFKLPRSINPHSLRQNIEHIDSNSKAVSTPLLKWVKDRDFVTHLESYLAKRDIPTYRSSIYIFSIFAESRFLLLLPSVSLQNRFQDPLFSSPIQTRDQMSPPLSTTKPYGLQRMRSNLS